MQKKSIALSLLIAMLVTLIALRAPTARADDGVSG